MTSPRNKKLDAYRGSLTAAEIAAGMNAASQNAKRLLADAELLLTNQRFPSAASLAILAIEEHGKTSILRELSVGRSPEEFAEAWRSYRSHTRKNLMWIFPQMVRSGARKLEEFRPLFDESSDHPQLLDQTKQLGFYTDCLGKRHWSVPAEVVKGELAQGLIEIARVLIGARDHTYTPKEIELWIEHIGPVWKGELAWMKQALVNWYAAMQAHGLSPEGPNEMEKFAR